MVKKTTKPDDLLTLGEAAQRYSYSPDYFRRLAEKGRLQARKVGRQWRDAADGRPSVSSEAHVAARTSMSPPRSHRF